MRLQIVSPGLMLCLVQLRWVNTLASLDQTLCASSQTYEANTRFITPAYLLAVQESRHHIDTSTNCPSIVHVFLHHDREFKNLKLLMLGKELEFSFSLFFLFLTSSCIHHIR